MRKLHLLVLVYIYFLTLLLTIWMGEACRGLVTMLIWQIAKTVTKCHLAMESIWFLNL